MRVAPLVVGLVAATLLGTATTASAATDAVSASCPVKLKWYDGRWSGCYQRGSHDIANLVVKAVKVAQRHGATVHWRAELPVKTYGPGTHDTSHIRNNVITVEVR